MFSTPSREEFNMMVAGFKGLNSLVMGYLMPKQNLLLHFNHLETSFLCYYLYFMTTQNMNPIGFFASLVDTFCVSCRCCIIRP